MVLSMKGRILTGLGVFLGLICVFYLLVYLPQVTYRQTLNRRISQQNSSLVQLNRKLRELEELKEHNQEMLRDLSFLEDKLKRTQASFLYELGVRGQAYGIEYVNIVPASTVEEKYYVRTPVNIHLYGKYHSLAMLFSEMAHRGEPGSFTVDNVLLKTSPKKEFTIEVNLTLSLYRYKSIAGSPQGNVSLSLEAIPSEREPQRRRR